ncbi:recombination-associated protein RdgC [Rhodanobacter glycinis]|uniref:recombination-associated protein RdgC n=1 Tax=Rhodanobacter glycinis TaxID=582702 RepID=UPI00112B7783|nr:recombination-associated protein RdgC [Rhodanobacter glycinis]TPG50699.1 recombination-associated protein RdgC [Rhodanobacter glycinis]
MFYRHLTLMRFSPAVAADLVQRLAEGIAEHPLRACGPLEMYTKGFVPPVGDANAPMTADINSCLFATVAGEDKLLPAAVLNDALRRKVQQIAEEEGRKVGGRERKRIREDLLTELLPRAFVRRSITPAYVDTKDGWMVIDTASRKQAESVLTQWREALGSFPAVPLAPEEGPRVLMTDWLANGNLPAGFALGDECELRDPATATGAIVRARRQDLDAEEVKEHLRNGKQVFALGLVFDGRISFVLGEDLSVRKLRFLDVVMDQLGDDMQDAETEATATWWLMTAELRRMLDKLVDVFGLPRPADL